MALVRPRQGRDHLVGLGARRVSPTATHGVPLRGTANYYKYPTLHGFLLYVRSPEVSAYGALPTASLCIPGGDERLESPRQRVISSDKKVLKGFRSYFRKGIIQTMMEAADEP